MSLKGKVKVKKDFLQIASKGSSAEEVKAGYRSATLSMARFPISNVFTGSKVFKPGSTWQVVELKLISVPRLNLTGARLMHKHKAGAATDVTG